MVCLSRPLRIVVKKGGEMVWKEMSFNKLPKDQQKSNLSRMPIYFLVVPFCVATVCYYAMAQYHFNPKSWVGIQVGKLTTILFPEQSNQDPMGSLKKRAEAHYKEFIETERALRRPMDQEQMPKEPKTEEQLRREAEELWEERRKEELNQALQQKYTEHVKMMKL